MIELSLMDLLRVEIQKHLPKGFNCTKARINDPFRGEITISKMGNGASTTITFNSKDELIQKLNDTRNPTGKIQ